ncbi:hypothetical protein [Botrimarina sp.]|uniref:hypothetical protein n=1 Tax=Botrimarina sp. TaxID=2795802 RepID=UPI0032EB0773
MKAQVNTRLACWAAAAAIVAAGAQATAQPIDNFDIGPGPTEYDTGNLLGQNPTIIGWTGAWRDGFQGDRAQVIGTGLTYPGLPTSGGAVQFGATDADGRIGRDLSNPVTGATDSRTLYLSFLMEADAAVEGSQITYGGFELHNANGLGDGDRQFQIVVGENTNGMSQSPNYQAVLFNSDSEQFFGDLGVNDGNVNLFVAKFELSDTDNMDAVSVWRNPSLAAEPSVADFSASGFNININSTSFARFGAAGVFQFDELRQGPTYESVTQDVPAFIPGDTDGDFVVEFEDDFFPIRDNWLETNATFGGPLARSDGDLDLSGAVDLRDFREWKNAYQGSPALVAEAFAQLAAIPEPACAALAMLAAAPAWLGRSRR